MNNDTVANILLTTILPGNFVLAMFLGMCPFLGVSQKLSTAVPDGYRHRLRDPGGLGVGLLPEHGAGAFPSGIPQRDHLHHGHRLRRATGGNVREKDFPELFRQLGIYLPLITTNCAVLGVALFQTARQYNFAQSLAYSIGGGIGFTLALILMAGVRERMQLSNVPTLVQGAALSVVIGGLLSLSFMGFSGIGRWGMIYLYTVGFLLFVMAGVGRRAGGSQPVCAASSGIRCGTQDGRGVLRQVHRRHVRKRKASLNKFTNIFRMFSYI